MSNEAVKEKNLGNEAYKKKDFVTAHAHYDKAIEADPTNMTFYNNKAAAFFEEGKYEECIAQCKKAVDVGREHRADFGTIAKAYARMANAHVKLGQVKEALLSYEKSLSEHRDPEVVKKHKQLEKEVKEKEKMAYINPEISNEEKNKGNELFKKGDYPNAMKHYNEAIKRNPDNAVLYSNRAACYTKLMEFQRAVEDCDTCLKKDPNFIKAYIRKGAALQAMREFSRAQRCYEDALKVDASNTEALEGLRTCYRSNDEDPEKARERALQDPEVQEILRDPTMRLILEQMSQDPSAAREHIKNPEIFEKLMKLRDAGIVQMR
ncbi:tetratricopeptide repeat domain-containing protein [Ditylenchus destructor]|uniref:Stress-induced-phosphoprotein 1 n=1 Tax=Ditylenchus destructor TaxID=166010 RepID=A0AAD4NA99_9BILA|nr:tetratricopeptide repeat domain-containing protein [Ditylenchus destructor]